MSAPRAVEQQAAAAGEDGIENRQCLFAVEAVDIDRKGFALRRHLEADTGALFQFFQELQIQLVSKQA